jgi:hypothetical protein
MATQNLKPLTLWKSLLLVLIPAAAAYIALHDVVPVLLAGTGHPFFVGYMIWWMTWMGLAPIVSLVAYRLGGNPLFQKWTLRVLLPLSLFYAYGAQKVRNTWVTIIVHGVMNLVSLVAIAIGVVGQRWMEWVWLDECHAHLEVAKCSAWTF